MKMNGSMYRDMVVSAACSLDNQKDVINNLNVFFKFLELNATYIITIDKRILAIIVTYNVISVM